MLYMYINLCVCVRLCVRVCVCVCVCVGGGGGQITSLDGDDGGIDFTNGNIKYISVHMPVSGGGASGTQAPLHPIFLIIIIKKDQSFD